MQSQAKITTHTKITAIPPALGPQEFYSIAHVCVHEAVEGEGERRRQERKSNIFFHTQWHLSTTLSSPKLCFSLT